MKTVSMVEFRKHADRILDQARKGERMILTYRNQPVLRLEPIIDSKVSDADPFYSLARLATGDGDPLGNEEIDAIIYET